MYPVRPCLTLLVLAAAVAGCAGTSGPCARPEARELRTVEKLIAETRADMARGYRTETSASNPSVNFCLGSGGGTVGVAFCADPSQHRRTVALDMAAEERKLDALEARRLALLSGIEAKQAACAPDGGV